MMVMLTKNVLTVLTLQTIGAHASTVSRLLCWEFINQVLTNLDMLLKIQAQVLLRATWLDLGSFYSIRGIEAIEECVFPMVDEPGRCKLSASLRSHAKLRCSPNM